MRKLTSRETFLLIAVAGLGVVGWIYGRGGSLGGSGMTDEELGKLNFGEPPVVQLAHLTGDPENYNANARNLFSYYTPPPPVQKRQPPTPRKAQEQQAPAPVVRRPPPGPAPVRDPPPPSPNFRYIGFMGPKDNKIAVLEQGDEVLLAAMGEEIDEQFKVVDFKYEALVIGYTSKRWADKTTDIPMKR